MYQRNCMIRHVSYATLGRQTKGLKSLRELNKSKLKYIIVCVAHDVVA